MAWREIVAPDVAVSFALKPLEVDTICPRPGASLPAAVATKLRCAAIPHATFSFACGEEVTSA